MFVLWRCKGLPSGRKDSRKGDGTVVLLHRTKTSLKFNLAKSLPAVFPSVLMSPVCHHPAGPLAQELSAPLTHSGLGLRGSGRGCEGAAFAPP